MDVHVTKHEIGQRLSVQRPDGLGRLQPPTNRANHSQPGENMLTIFSPPLGSSSLQMRPFHDTTNLDVNVPVGNSRMQGRNDRQT